MDRQFLGATGQFSGGTITEIDETGTGILAASSCAGLLSPCSCSLKSQQLFRALGLAGARSPLQPRSPARPATESVTVLRPLILQVRRCTEKPTEVMSSSIASSTLTRRRKRE